MSEFIWTDWNLEHIARHGVSRDEAEEVVRRSTGIRISDRYRVFGTTDAGRYLLVVLVRREAGAVFVITARNMDAAEKRRYRRP